MRRTVYLETTIPSFYCEARQEAEMVARRNWTRRLLDECGERYSFVCSEAVVMELEAGDFPGKDAALQVVDRYPLLMVEPQVGSIAETYVRRMVMPRDPLGDALHLALASWWKCDYLATWNCSHLANPNKARSIAALNGELGLFVPQLVTPLQLLEESTDA